MASNSTSTPSTASGRSVHVTPASAVSDTSTGQTQGMIRQSAIVDISPHMCGTLMRAQPRSGSAVHHHGEQDTVVYAVSGEGAIVSEGGKKVRPYFLYVWFTSFLFLVVWFEVWG